MSVQVIRGVLKEEGSRPESWWEIDGSSVDKLLEPFEGKRVKITIEEEEVKP